MSSTATITTTTQASGSPIVHLVPSPKASPQNEDVAARVPVLLPNMFASFLAQKPRVNPHYEKVKAESEAWINSKCQFDARMSKRIRACDFSYFTSISAPEANEEELRTMCDWGNWVFPWDDMFDNGHLRDNPAEGKRQMDQLLAVMRGKISLEPKDPLVEVHDLVWQRLCRHSSEGTQRRFHAAMESYCAGALLHVDQQSQSRIPTLAEQLQTRRRSSGVTPLYALVEYAHHLRLPDYVFDHQSIKEIKRLGTDFIVIQNDILSYMKEEKEGVNHNLVAICRMQGMEAQAAFDRVAGMLDACYRDWYMALAGLPSWGEDVDREVQRYIQGVMDVVLANLNWSFKSQRYLGKAHDEIRQTRQISVLRQPPSHEIAISSGLLGKTLAFPLWAIKTVWAIVL